MVKPMEQKQEEEGREGVEHLTCFSDEDDEAIRGLIAKVESNECWWLAKTKKGHIPWKDLRDLYSSNSEFEKLFERYSDQQICKRAFTLRTRPNLKSKKVHFTDDEDARIREAVHSGEFLNARKQLAWKSINAGGSVSRPRGIEHQEAL